MKKGLILSGLGHLGLVLWALLGGWFTWTSETPPIQVAQVSLISTAEFDAMTSAAPKVEDKAPTPELQPPATKTPNPAAKLDVPKPKPATPSPAPDKPKPKPADPAPDLPKPVDPAPIPDPAPVAEEQAPDPPVVPAPVAPPSDKPQPIEVAPSDKAPAPRAAERIASTPVEATDAPQTADEATPAQIDTSNPISLLIPDKPAASPQETVTAITPDAKPSEDDAPQLAPTSSPRPPARPKPVEKPPADPAPTKTQTLEPAPEQAPEDSSAADQAAIDAALADATAPEAQAAAPVPSASGSGGTGDKPVGAALNSGEVDNLRRVIEPLWSIGSLSTDAARVVVTMRIQLSQDQKIESVEMVDFTGGSEANAKLAFEAAKRAVIRGASKGLGLPPDKYDTWKSMLFTFDTSQGRLR